MIFKTEEKILSFLEKNIAYIVLGLVVLFNIAVRYSMRGFTNSDLSYPLTNWYNEIKAGGGFRGLGQEPADCSYNIPYLTLIAVFTYLPGPAAMWYKVSSGLCDFIQAIALAKLVYNMVDNNNKFNKAVVTFVVGISSPLVLMNSAGWGQCDSVYAAFAILALLFLSEEKFKTSFVMLGIALGFKLQAIFILPVFLFYYLVKKKFSVVYFGIVPLVMEIMSLPAIIAGRGVFDVFTKYMHQTDWYPTMAKNYPTFWTLFTTIYSTDNYNVLKMMAITTTVIIIGCVMYVMIYMKSELNLKNLLLISYISTLTCAVFLPGMHERYAYLAELLVIALIFINWKFVVPAIGMLMVSMTTYGNFLFNDQVLEDMTVLAWINVVVYMIAIILTCYEIFCKDSQEKLSKK